MTIDIDNFSHDRQLVPYLSVVLSFRNEEEVLAELIARLRKVLGEERINGNISSYELIFINDDSTDQSEKVILNEAKGHNDIKIINMSRRFGVSPCVMAGMEYSSGDIVVYMDADLQDPPEVIPEMIKAWRENSSIDIVHTVRLLRAGESAIKLWITRVGYLILRKVSSITLQVEAGDFKLLSRRAVDQLIKLKEKKPFMRGLASWIGFNSANVYYNREPRFAGKTKFKVISFSVLGNFFESALISFSSIPLQISSFAGFLVSIGALIYLIYIVIEKFLGHNLPGWSAIMVTMLFLGGVQLLSLGIIGLYLSSIYLETKGRPNYIIKSTFGFDNTENSDSKEQKKQLFLAR